MLMPYIHLSIALLYLYFHCHLTINVALPNNANIYLRVVNFGIINDMLKQLDLLIAYINNRQHKLKKKLKIIKFYEKRNGGDITPALAPWLKFLNSDFHVLILLKCIFEIIYTFIKQYAKYLFYSSI